MTFRILFVLFHFLIHHLALSQGKSSPFKSLEKQGALDPDALVANLLKDIHDAELRKDTLAVIELNNTLIIRCSLMNILDRAEEVGQRNIALSLKMKDSCLLGQTYNSYGIYLSHRLEYDRFENIVGKDFEFWNDSSIYYYQMASKIDYQGCSYDSRGWALAGLMRQYFFKARMGDKDFNKAIYYGRKAEREALLSGGRQLQQDCYVWMARCYAHLAEYDSAKKYIRQAYEIAQERDGGYHGVYNVWFGVLVKETANDTILWLHHEILDRMKYQLGGEMQSAIQDADRKYETEKKEQEIMVKNDTIKRRNTIINITIAIIVFVLFVSLYLFRLYRKNRNLSRRNELLLKEQNHRVKNNLQMISSLLSLQSQKLLSTDAKEALTDSQARVNSVALLHRMLYEGEQVGFVDVAQYLKSLTEEVKYASHRELEVQLEVSKELMLKVERATSLGLIINELMTNSIKHARTESLLLITISIIGSDDQIILDYRDNGEEMDIRAWESSDSFGNQLIKIQSEQMNGQFKISSKNGFNYQLRLKVG